MISVYQIKPKFQQLLKPLLGIFHKVGITANGITWMAILLSTAIGVLFWFFPNGPHALDICGWSISKNDIKCSRWDDGQKV